MCQEKEAKMRKEIDPRKQTLSLVLRVLDAIRKEIEAEIRKNAR